MVKMKKDGGWIAVYNASILADMTVDMHHAVLSSEEVPPPESGDIVIDVWDWPGTGMAKARRYVP